MNDHTCYAKDCTSEAVKIDDLWWGTHCEAHQRGEASSTAHTPFEAQSNEEGTCEEWIYIPSDECPNCGGTISVNGDRYSSEGPRALICEGCELVYA